MGQLPSRSKLVIMILPFPLNSKIGVPCQMFSHHFYNRLFRKYIILFGNVFSNITIKRMNADFTTEIERIKVPILWAAKERYMQKAANESETPAVQTVLPRMSFELIGINYDTNRKLANLQRYATLNSSNNSVVWATYESAPYTLDFRLNMHTRNLEDLFQIIEQILPYFQPDYTPTANLLDNLRIPKDLRISLRSISPDFGFEGPLGDSTRDIYASMVFSMQVYFFGPVTNEKVITKVITKVYAERSGPIVVNMGSGNGVFSEDDTVYQGNSASFASASGTLRHVYFSSNTKQLMIDVTGGVFRANSIIRSMTGNGAYVMTSEEDALTPAITFTITPSPLTANADSTFGLDIKIDTPDEDRT